MRVVLELRALAPAPAKAGRLEEKTAAFSRALIEYAGEHELALVFTYVCEDAIQRLHDRFPDLSTNPDFHLARLPLPKADDSDGHWMRQAADALRENAILQFSPDVVISALFSRSAEAADSVALRLANVPVAMVLSEDQCDQRAANLSTADLLLIFSERSERELSGVFGIAAEKIVAIAPHADKRAVSRETAPEREQSARETDRLLPAAHARRIFEALERMLSTFRESRRMARVPGRKAGRKPRMAYVSPLPPERSGIADYSRELLPHLAAYYEIDLITDLSGVADRGIQNSFRLVTARQFRKSAKRYERILYHIGNSPFHSGVASLMAKYPGCVVLHDFFLSHLFYHLDGIDGTALWRALYESHGYPGLAVRSREGAEAAVWKYPCNLTVLSQAAGVIVHSEYARNLAAQWYGDLAEEWRTVPQLRRVAGGISREKARRALGMSPDTFLVCSFGFTAPTKLNRLVLDGWAQSGLAGRDDCSLVFVGGDGEGKPFSVDSQLASRVLVTGYVSGEAYENYLAAADVAVQLRSGFSRGETPRSVLDCMAHRIATLVNSHPIVADLPSDSVFKIAENPDASGVAAALERLHREVDFRTMLGRRAQEHIRATRDPAHIAKLYAEAVEHFALGHPETVRNRAIERIAKMRPRRRGDPERLAEVASCLSENSQKSGMRQLLVDVTVLFSLGDYQTGIHRVTRAILSQLLENPPAGYRVEPVYRPYQKTYRYARSFTARLLGLDAPILEDAPVGVNKGDMFLGLDWDPGIDDVAAEWLMHHRRRGMRTVMAIYDLLPLQRSEWFKPEMAPVFRDWISRIAAVADTCVCISRAVADELLEWLNTYESPRMQPLDVGYFHLGSDLESSLASQGLSGADRAILEIIDGRDVVAMIGTVEPRKGHVQALEAMEMLWQSGERAILVICGKQGWMVDSVAERIRSHPQMGSRLFWMDSASDEALLRLYSKASVVLMASEGEGFGLPLVEAAKHRVPIIARDLPVFREVAGAHAFYFSGLAPAGLADALGCWLKLYRRGAHTRSDQMPWLNWEESTKELLRVALGTRVYCQWRPKRLEQNSGSAEKPLLLPLDQVIAPDCEQVADELQGMPTRAINEI